MFDNKPTTLLNLRRLPGRVDYQGAAFLLNYEVVAIKALVDLGYLRPLGSPKGNEHKYFSSKTISQYAEDEKWLNETSRALIKYWADKNNRRKANALNPSRIKREYERPKANLGITS